jgi:hypothetical protein
LQPYVIRQGDYLLSLAYQFGFDADTVWNDPQNAQLRQDGHLSQDPNILNPTDTLYIPDQNVPPVMQSLTTGATNTFVANIPTATLTQQFVGSDTTTYASKAYTIQELAELTGLTTDENGIATFQAPVTLDTATIEFTDTGKSWVLHIGHLDPISTLSGIFQRLQHLNYVAGSATLDPNNLDLLRAGLEALKASQASGSDATPDSTPASGPPSSPDSAPASNPNGANSGNSGLADDGTLDAATTALLLKVHGC